MHECLQQLYPQLLPTEGRAWSRFVKLVIHSLILVAAASSPPFLALAGWQYVSQSAPSRLSFSADTAGKNERRAFRSPVLAGATKLMSPLCSKDRSRAASTPGAGAPTPRPGKARSLTARKRATLPRLRAPPEPPAPPGGGERAWLASSRRAAPESWPWLGVTLVLCLRRARKNVRA